MIDDFLEKKEVDTIFRMVIFPEITKYVKQGSNNIAYIVGGQPGSGKSSFAQHLMQENKDLVFINGDDLRIYHPKYVSYLEEDDRNAADKTQSICNYWIEKAIEKCIESGLSFIVEGTMRTDHAPLTTAMIAHESGYDVYGCVIATPYDLSIASINYRYNETKRIEGHARYTKKESHDEAYANLPKTLEKLIGSNLFSKFFVYKRLDGSFEKHEFNLPDFEKILPLFKEGREHNLTERELDFIKNNINPEIHHQIPKIKIT